MSYIMPPEASDQNALVKMFGPSLTDPSKMVNRDVPLRDVAAYSRAGYQKGSIPERDPVAFKSAETGEFVSEETAEANPSTTYKTRKRKNALA